MSLSRCLPVLLLLASCAEPMDVDLDGDGFSAEVDCDDTDPEIFPDQVEVPYDGIDNGCRGFDALDLDADGYAGIPFSVYAQRLNLPETLVVWPSSVSRTEWDCDDFRGQVHPNATEDQPYDGIDQDCLGDNDFDVDHDGQMPTRIGDHATVPLVTAYIARWSHLAPIDLDAPDAYGDCNDFDPSVRTGVADAPYDGIDSNCDGANDFDQDEDGYYPAPMAANFLAYVLEVAPDTAPDGPARWSAPGQASALPGDCVDAPIDLLPQLDPAMLNPAAEETWYDGIDSNCDGADDFDQDGDGYHSSTDHAAWEDFLWLWTLLGTSPQFTSSGDCDDLEPSAYPGGPESLFDTIDGDCDGGIDTARFTFGRVAWQTPGAVRLAKTDTHFVAAVTAEARNPIYNPEPDLEHPGIALVFPMNTTTQAGPEAVFHWGGDLVKQDAALVAWGDGFATANTALDDEGTRLQLQSWGWQGTGHSSAGASTVVYPGFELGTVALSAEQTSPLAAWCTAGSVEMLDLAGPVATLPFAGESCWLDADLPTACVDCTRHGPLRIGIEHGITVSDGTREWHFLEDEVMLSADAVWAGHRLVVAAVVSRAEGPVVLWGSSATPSMGLETLELRVEDDDPAFEHVPAPSCQGLTCGQGRTLRPYSIAVEASDDRILLAVSALSQDTPLLPRHEGVPLVQDAVGWSVLHY